MTDASGTTHLTCMNSESESEQQLKLPTRYLLTRIAALILIRFGENKNNNWDRKKVMFEGF
jgi:hypothetical protein